MEPYSADDDDPADDGHERTCSRIAVMASRLRDSFEKQDYIYDLLVDLSDPVGAWAGSC